MSMHSYAPSSSSFSEFSRLVLVPAMFDEVSRNLSTVKASVTGFPRGALMSEEMVLVVVASMAQLIRCR